MKNNFFVNFKSPVSRIKISTLILRSLFSEIRIRNRNSSPFFGNVKYFRDEKFLPLPIKIYSYVVAGRTRKCFLGIAIVFFLVSCNACFVFILKSTSISKFQVGHIAIIEQYGVMWQGYWHVFVYPICNPK